MGIIFLFMMMVMAMPVPVYADSFGEQIEIAAAELPPDARAEFRDIIGDLERFGDTLEEMGAPKALAARLQEVMKSDGVVTAKEKLDFVNQISNRSDEIDEKHLAKLDDRLAEKADKIAEEAAKAVAKAEKVGDKVDEEAAKVEDKVGDKADEELDK